MKNRTKNPQKESLEASSGSGTSMKAAVISILVLHLAIGIGFISQGCKKENSSNSSDLVDNKNNESTTPQSSSVTGDGSPSTQGTGIPSIERANQLLDSGRNAQAGSAPPNYQASYAPSNQVGNTADLPRIPQNLDIDETSESGGTSPEVKRVPPPPVVKTNRQENSFIVPNPDDLDPVHELNGSYGQSGNTNETENSGSTGYNSAANSGSGSSSTSGRPSTDTDSGFKVVTIEKGDTIGKYAREYKTTLDAIRKLNPQIADLGRIQIGWEVKIPLNSAKPPEAPAGRPASSGSVENNNQGAGQGVVYEVQKGDNLYNIGLNYGIPWKEIVEFNNLKTANLKIGQKLKIPAK